MVDTSVAAAVVAGTWAEVEVVDIPAVAELELVGRQAVALAVDRPAAQAVVADRLAEPVGLAQAVGQRLAHRGRMVCSAFRPCGDGGDRC